MEVWRVPGETTTLLAAQAAAFQALLLAASAVHKMLRWNHLLTVLHRFAGLSVALAPALAGIVAVELAAAAMLWLPGLRLPGALLATAVWAASLVLILRAIRQDRADVDCGCSFGASRGRLGSYHVARNSVLLALALGVACASLTDGPSLAAGTWVPRGASTTVVVQVSQVLAGFALLALYGALDQVLNLPPLRRGEAA